MEDTGNKNINKEREKDPVRITVTLIRELILIQFTLEDAEPLRFSEETMGQ